MTALFDRIGGHPALTKAVDIFYEKVRSDELIKDFWSNTDMEDLKSKQFMFLQHAFGGPNQYSGKDLRDSHKPLVDKGLDDMHFDATKKHLLDTLSELGVAQSDIDEVDQIFESQRANVLNR